MSLVVAYAFQCEKTLAQILATLQTGTGWAWVERSSDIWDDYLSANSPGGEFIVKIFQKLEAYSPPDPADHGRYVFEFKCLTDDAERDWQEHTRFILEQLVPILGATGVASTRSYN